jgi:polysaccharide export outer membrane protein
MTLGPDDVVTIRVYGEEDLSGDYQIDSDGGFAYPLLGKVEAGGKTPAQVVAEIRSGLADGYLKNPQVSLLIKEYNSRRVTVYGEVLKAGEFPFTNGMSIAEAISQAGGFTQLADQESVRVKRVKDGLQQTVVVDVKSIAEGRASDYYLLPGDQVFVPHRIL